MQASLRKQIASWLFFTAGFVFLMIVIGGLTRLTESGLSIVEWKVVSGTLPPLSAEAWQQEFAEYKTSPQYQKINKGMSLAEFKNIFWLEYLHRLFGRAIGFVFFVPLLYFTLRHTLPGGLKWRLVGIFVLGGLQGAIGWYMVKSGLVDQPMVSPYRLALHLGVAFLIMGALIWVGRDVLRNRWAAPPATHNRSALRGLSCLAGIMTAVIFLQVLLGALVAGLDAGLIYNTFPLMDGRFVPKGLYIMDEWWRNHFENVTMVQFQHRMGAYVTTAVIALFALQAWRGGAIIGRMRLRLMLFLGVLAVQIGLGIVTLLQHVPIMLASKHQAVAAILFALSVWIWYDIRRLAFHGEEGAERELRAGPFRGKKAGSLKYGT